MGILVAMEITSTPRGIILKQSQVVDGLGAWSSLPIVEGGLFGPFARDVENEKDEKAYTWKVYDACTNELLQVVNGTDAVSASWMRYIRNARFLEEQNMISTQVGAQIFYKAIKDIGPNEELLTFLGHAEPKKQQMETEGEKISKKRSRSKRFDKNGESTFEDNNNDDDDEDKPEMIAMKLKKVKKENVPNSPSSKNTSERTSPSPKMEKGELPKDNPDSRTDELGGEEPETSLPNTRQLNKQQRKDKDNNNDEEDGFYYFFETRQCNVVESKGTKLYKCDVCKGVYHYAFSLKRHFLRNHINWKYLSEADISNCMINVVQQDMVAKRQPTGRRAKLNSSSAANNRASSKPHFVSNSVSRSELYRCSLCSELFDYIEDLVEHTHHHMTSPPSVAPMVAVKTHLVCSTCNMKFTYKQNFIRHQAVHSGERPFQCEFCFRTFPTQISRKQHIRIHIFNTKNKTANSNKNSSSSSNSTNNSNNNNSSSNKISSSSSSKISSSSSSKISSNSSSRISSSSSSSSNKVVSAPVVKPTVKVEPEPEVPKEEDLKCQICGKIFSCSSFLNKHIVCMHNGAMKRKANQNRRANHQKESAVSTVKTEPVEVESANSTDPQAVILKALKTAKKKNQFKYVCSICQRKFRLYIQMCKHKRAAHGKTLTAKKKAGFYDLEQTGLEDELLPGDLEAPYLESKDVAENVARNLGSFIDGNIDSLSDFTKYVKIKGYTSVHEYDPDFAKQTDVTWSQYNFPASFQMPVEDTKTLDVSCKSENLTCLPSPTTLSMLSDQNKEACSTSTLPLNLPAVTASPDHTNISSPSSTVVDGKESCVKVEPDSPEESSSEKSDLLSSSNSDPLSGSSSAAAGTSIFNSCLETPNTMTTNSTNICDISIVNQSSSVISNLPIVMNVNLPIVSQIPNGTLTQNSALAVPLILLPSTVSNLTNVPAATNLGPSVDNSNANSASSLVKDNKPIIDKSSSPPPPPPPPLTPPPPPPPPLTPPPPPPLTSGHPRPEMPVLSHPPNLSESSNSGKSVRFQSAFLVHEFSSDGASGPKTESAIKEEILLESTPEPCLSLNEDADDNNDDTIEANSDIAIAPQPKSFCDSNLSSSSLDNVTQDMKTSSLSTGNNPTDSAKPSDKSLKSVQKDVLFSGPHMMTAHIHERGHMVLEFGDDKEVSSKVKNIINPQSEETPKPFSLKSHGLVKKSKKNQNLLDFSIQHIVKMRVQEYKDYVAKTNPPIKLEDTSCENKDTPTNNELCLASYPSCDLASKLGDCVDKTSKDFNKISAFLKSGLLPREKLQDLEKSVPSFSFGGKENFSLDYSQMAFGKHGTINFVCSVCRKHFLSLDPCLRHQQHRHPSIECNFLEVELGNSIVPLHYPLPDRDGLLSQSTVDLSACKNLKAYTCSKCSSSFPTVTRLHSHIVRCATNPPDMDGIIGNVIGKRKYKKRLKKRLRDVLNGSNTFKFRLKDFAGYDPTLFQENQVQRRRFRGCRNRKIVTVHETLMKTRKRRNYDLSYDPKNHVRRRESVEVVEKQQCRGCNMKFKSISLLERHAPNCSRKDKLQNLKVLEGIRTPAVRTGRPLHRCHYCNKQFTYLKSLCNHYLNCMLRKQQERIGSLQPEDLIKERRMANLEREKSFEELTPFLGKESPENEQHLNIVRKGGWPKGLKRKFRRKNHSWTCIKRKRLKDSEYVKDNQENESQGENSNDGLKTEIKIEPDVKVAEKNKACLEELLISNASEKGSKKPVELSNSSCCRVQSTGVSVNAELKPSKAAFAYRATTTTTSSEKQWKNISESELYKQLTKNISSSTLSSDIDGNSVVLDSLCQNQVSVVTELDSVEKNDVNKEIPRQSVNESESSDVISGQKDLKEVPRQHLVVVDLVSKDPPVSSKCLSSKVSTAIKPQAELESATQTKPEEADPEYCQEISCSSSSLRKDIDDCVTVKESVKKTDLTATVANPPQVHSSILASCEKSAKCNDDSILEQPSHSEKREIISEPMDQSDMLSPSQDVPSTLIPDLATKENPETGTANQEVNSLVAATCSVNGSALMTNSTSSFSSLPENTPQTENPPVNDQNLPAVAVSPLSPLDKNKCQLEAYDEDCQSSLLATEEMDMPRQFETVIDIEPCEMVVESKETVTMIPHNHIAKQELEISKTDVVVDDDVVKDTCKVFEVVPATPNVILNQGSNICQANMSTVEYVSPITEDTATTKFIQTADHLSQLPAQVILSSNQIKQLSSQMTFSNAQLPQVTTPQVAFSHAQLLQLPAQVTLSNGQLLQLPASVALPSAQMSLSNVQLAQLPTQMALSNTQLAQLPNQVTLANAHLTTLPTHVALSNPQLSSHLTFSNTPLAQLQTQVTLSNNQLTQLPTQVTLSNAHLAQISTQVILSNAQLTPISPEMPVPNAPQMSRPQVQVLPSNAELNKSGTKLIWPQPDLTRTNIKLSQPQVDMTLSNPNFTCSQADVTPTNAVLTQVNRDIPLLQTDMNLPNVELSQAKVKLLPPPPVEIAPAKPEMPQSNALLIKPKAPVTQGNAKSARPLTQMTPSNSQLTWSNVKSNRSKDAKKKKVILNQPQVLQMVPPPPPSSELCQANIIMPRPEIKVTNVSFTHPQRDVTLLDDSLTQTNAKSTMPQTESDIPPRSEINRQEIKLTSPNMDSMLSTDKIIESPTKLMPVNKPCQATVSSSCVDSHQTDFSSSTFTKVEDSNLVNPSQPVELVNVQCGFSSDVCQLGNSFVSACEQDSSSANTSASFSVPNETTVMADEELTRLEKMKENLDSMEAQVGQSSSSDIAEIPSKSSESLQHFEKSKQCQEAAMPETVGETLLATKSPSVPENSSSETEFTPLTSLNFESELELEVVPEAIMEGDILYEDFPPSASCVAITNSTTTLETPPDCRKSLPVSAVPMLNSKPLKLMSPTIPFSSVPISDLISYDPSSLSERNNYVLCIVPEFQMSKMPSTSAMQSSSSSSDCQSVICCDDDDGNQSEAVACQGPTPQCDVTVTTQASVTESDTFNNRNVTHLPQPRNADNVDIQ